MTLISNNVIQLDSYGHVSAIYIISHNIPSHVWFMETNAHMFY